MMLTSKHLMDSKIGGAVGKPVCSAIVLVGALLAMSTADAAGLGRLNVLSDLGQPLKAEIDIVSVEKGELDSLRAKLAPIDSYVQNNLPYPGPSLGLQLSVEKRPSGAPYIIATTVQPVNEPFIDILVELTWNGGSILRAYTALLDPPAYNTAERAHGNAEAAAPEVRPAPLAAPEPAAAETAVRTDEEAATRAAPQPQAAAQAPAPAPEKPAPKAPESSAVGSGREAADYTVKHGDTLSRIARQHMTEGVSLDQMLVLLFKSNPEAFSGRNMNRLKAGRLLKIPGTAEAAAIDAQEARREVRVHTANFNAYRQQLAAAAGESAGGETAGQGAAGGVTAHVEEKAASAGEPKEVLKLSKGQSAGAPASGAERIRNLEEELAARQKTIAEQSERLAMLDKQVKDMQALLAMKNKGMATVEKSAVPEKPAAAPGKPSAEAAKPAETPVAVAPAPLPAAKPAPESAAPSAKPAEPAAPQAHDAAPKKKAKVVAPPVPAPGLMDQVLQEPMYLGAGAAIAGLLGFLGFRALRRRKADQLEAGEPEAVAAAPFTGTVNPEMPSAAAAAAPAQVSEEVDPLAEADIYLAYGRDTQAEEILKEAMQNTPRRQEVQLKLLEIYAKRKDVAGFDGVARELQQVSNEQGDAWLQAVRLGYQLDPLNPRYAAGKPSGTAEPLPAAAAAVAASTALDDKLDFDIGLNDAHSTTRTDIDLSNLGAGSGVNTDLDLTRLSGGRAPAEAFNPSALAALDQDEIEQPLDLDLGRADTISAEQKPARLDFDFDLSTLSGDPMQQTMVEESRKAAEGMSTVNQESALGGMDFDLSKLGLDDNGKKEPMLDARRQEPSVDLSSIDLNLDKPAQANASAPRDDHWYDVQTKFDLAKAYQEMGDKEGAREILREVIAEGDNDQQVAAQRVLETLA